MLSMSAKVDIGAAPRVNVFTRVCALLSKISLILAVMLLLAWGKHRTGMALQNPVLVTEGRVTLVDAYLAAAVLVGLVLNSQFGWWWADPIAGLVIVYYGFREGRHAWHEASQMA